MVNGETRIALLMLVCREWGIQVPIPHFHLVFFIFSTPSLLLVFFDLAVFFSPSSFLLHAFFEPRRKNAGRLSGWSKMVSAAAPHSWHIAVKDKADGLGCSLTIDIYPNRPLNPAYIPSPRRQKTSSASFD